METAIYRKYAKYYDLIYSFKDYKKESIEITKLITKYKKAKGTHLLDLGCGTGKHLEYLKNGFDCTGLDLNKEMLRIAKANIKDVNFVNQNMVSFKLKQKFDVITSLFSAIGYVKTPANLERTLQNIYKHLSPGGITLINPWFDKKSYNRGHAHMNVYDSPDIKIARLSVSEVKGNLSIMDMHHLVAESNKGMSYFVDHHELGMFDKELIIKLMNKAGFKTIFLPNAIMKGRGTYIGIKN